MDHRGDRCKKEEEKQVEERPTADERSASINVYDWLFTKGIQVINYREEDDADIVFDELALFLGERYKSIARFFESVRRNLASGATVTLNMSSASQEEIANTTQFCTMLSSYAFLSSYNYSKTSKIIHATPQRIGKVINFFTGEWFERFIYVKIRSFFETYRIPYQKLLNPQITLQNGDNFELDLLFLIDNKPLWVERKTGDYSAHITKCSSFAKTLSAQKKRAILVILNIPSDLTAKLTYLHNMTIANENTFLEHISKVFTSNECSF